MYLSDDVLRIIFDFLLGSIENKPCLKEKSYKLYGILLIDKQFYRLTKIYLPECFSCTLELGYRKWCKIHDKYEWLLANHIKNNQDKYLKILERLDDKLHHKVSFHYQNSIPKDKLKTIFNKVTYGMHYRFSHSCCSGKGIMFYI